MRVVRATLLAGAAESRGLTVIVDVFRAFTTACLVASASVFSWGTVRRPLASQAGGGSTACP